MRKMGLFVSSLAFFLLVLALATPAQARCHSTFRKATNARKRGDYKVALPLYRQCANKGIAPAQHNLGIAYQNGHGVPKDLTEAARWYRMAAEQGLPKAQYSLGWRYMKGEGVPKDLPKALFWFRKAAAQGHTGAKKVLKKVAEFRRKKR